MLFIKISSVFCALGFASSAFAGVETSARIVSDQHSIQDAACLPGSIVVKNKKTGNLSCANRLRATTAVCGDSMLWESAWSSVGLAHERASRFDEDFVRSDANYANRFATLYLDGFQNLSVYSETIGSRAGARFVGPRSQAVLLVRSELNRIKANISVAYATCLGNYFKVSKFGFRPIDQVISGDEHAVGYLDQVSYGYKVEMLFKNLNARIEDLDELTFSGELVAAEDCEVSATQCRPVKKETFVSLKAGGGVLDNAVAIATRDRSDKTRFSLVPISGEVVDPARRGW